MSQEQIKRMTELEYKEALKELAAEYENNKVALAKDFAISNNTVKYGDIITDHIGSLEVKRMTVSTFSKQPQMVYYGIELKKDLTPMKNQTNRAVYQSNLIKNHQ
jgi:hypothetical protein